MIRDIKLYPAKVLKKKAKKVGEIDHDIKKLISDMIETLYASRGVGLAANQVGILKQIIVVDDSRGGGDVKIIINPRISQRRGSEILAEGCLSFPGLELEIKRPQKILLRYLDEKGCHQEIKAEDMLARIICHEVDHLRGRTFLDRLGLLKRLKLKRQLKKATKGN